MARSGNPNPKRNNTFSKAPQGLDDKKSQGQINRSKELNILSHIRSNIHDRNIISKTFDVIETELEAGITKNAIEVLKIAKENEKQDINLTGGVEVQKVYITKEEQEEVKKHIDEMIGL